MSLPDIPHNAKAIRADLRRRTDDAIRHRMGLPPLPPVERTTARGIGFGVELVRAIADGRKTQTRRLVRPQPTDVPNPVDCPAARVGELLYVREPFLPAENGFVYAIDAPAESGRKFKAGMYMPRRAARLWLRVIAVRAERLRAISAEDLAAEGLPAGQSLASVWDGFYPDAGHRFADDPWVWAIEFRIENGPQMNADEHG